MTGERFGAVHAAQAAAPDFRPLYTQLRSLPKLEADARLADDVPIAR
jgi:hypothetical protein